MKATTKVQKTDTRSLEQVAKSIAAMRRRVGAAVRRHNKLQQRIAKLTEQGRIVSLSHYSDILTGIECWYVKADSLNPNPDSINNWYYEVTYSAERGYGCGCEDVRQCDCKHAKALGSYLHAEKEEQEVQAYFLGLCQKQPETKKLSAEEANQFFMEQAEKRNQAPLNGQVGFSLMR